jgi:hypothetical protein
MFRTILSLAFAAIWLVLSGVSMADPIVIQAAGPTAKTIKSAVTKYRALLGEPNNGNTAGPLQSGRREINWDGGGSDATTSPVTPFNTFLNTRGSQFTTPGTGLTQAPPSGGLNGGLATLLNNPTYATTFRAFSPVRLFGPVGSNVTDTLFFIPGSNGTVPATVNGFGAIFTDVDQPDSGPKKKARTGSTLIEYFDANGELIFRSFVSSSSGDGNFSFFGIVFEEPVIARVRITTGNAILGPDDNEGIDVVLMDDFFYGEPKAIP